MQAHREATDVTSADAIERAGALALASIAKSTGPPEADAIEGPGARRAFARPRRGAVHRPGAPHAGAAPRLCARRQQAGAQRRLGSRDALARNWRAGRNIPRNASFFTLSKRKGLSHLSGSRPRDRRFHVERKTKERQH